MTRSASLRRLVAGLVGATLIGALVAPAAVLAAPAGAADLITTTEDSATVTGNVLTNDTEMVRSAGLVITDATPGTLTVASNGDYEFTPAANWNGTNTAVGYYWADSDQSAGGELLTWIRVTVTAVNDVPVATAQSVSATEDIDLPLTLAGTDVEGSALTYAIVTGPAHGSLSGSGSSRTYTPDADYYGADSFTFTVNDGTDDSATATVSIDVVGTPDLPTADSASVNVVYETAAAITLTGEDVDNEALTFTVLTQPAHGVLTGTAPDLTYTPADAYTGSDSFTFKVEAGGDETAPGTISITVADDLVAPVVTGPSVAFGSGRVNESAPLRIGWSATDAGVGGVTYVVQAKVGAGAWTQIYAGTGTTVTKLYAFGVNLQWRVMASDANDNDSAWATSAVRKLYAYQGTSPVATSGTWAKVASSGSSGTNYYYTSTSGKYKRLTFSGVAVAFVAPKMSSGGRVTVNIDGTNYARSTWKSGTTALGQVIKSRSLTDGTHTIRVTNAQGGRRATFDAFIVMRIVP